MNIAKVSIINIHENEMDIHMANRLRSALMMIEKAKLAVCVIAAEWF